MEKIHLATTRLLPLSPKLSPHLSRPARWLLLDLYLILPPSNIPSVPAHLETHQHHAALCSSGQSSRLTSPCVLAVVAQLHLWWVSRASMCIFNLLNHGECSAGFTESTWLQGGVDRVMIQLNTLQAPHYPETLDRSKSNSTDHTT